MDLFWQAKFGRNSGGESRAAALDKILQSHLRLSGSELQRSWTKDGTGTTDRRASLNCFWKMLPSLRTIPTDTKECISVSFVGGWPSGSRLLRRSGRSACYAFDARCRKGAPAA